MGALIRVGGAYGTGKSELRQQAALPRAQTHGADPRPWPNRLDAGAAARRDPAMARTHRPLGRRPRLSRRRGWQIAAAMVLLTGLWLGLGTLWFVAWQQSEALAVASRVHDVCQILALPDPPGCAAEWQQAQARIAAERPQHLRAAVEAASLVAIIFWLLVAGLVAIAHWIVSGEAPRA